MNITKTKNSKYQKLSEELGVSKDIIIKISERLSGMKSRCNNKNLPNYGGKGVSVCQEWLDSREDFIRWSIANGFSPELTIDRIDNDGNYEPSNCRWVPYHIQANNKSYDNGLPAGIRYYPKTNKYCAEIRTAKYGYKNLGYALTIEEAVELRKAYIKEKGLVSFTG